MYWSDSLWLMQYFNMMMQHVFRGHCALWLMQYFNMMMQHVFRGHCALWLMQYFNMLMQHVFHGCWALLTLNTGSVSFADASCLLLMLYNYGQQSLIISRNAAELQCNNKTC